MKKNILAVIQRVYGNMLCDKSDLGRYVYAEAYLLRDGQAIAPAPYLTMGNQTFRELAYYFSKMPKEMQVMGFVEQDNENCFAVGELVIPPHASGFADADLDQNQFIPWLDALEADGKDIMKLRFQAHSHGFTPAFFSGTDIDTIRSAYSCDWMISLVGNRESRFLARLDVYKPVPISIALPLIVEAPLFPASEKEQELWNANLDPFMVKERRRHG